MTRTPSPAAALAPARDAIAIALCAVVVYSLCAPRILYGPDAFTFFQMAQQGHATHWMHLLYVPILRLARTLGAPLGIAPFHAFVGASSVAGRSRTPGSGNNTLISRASLRLSTWR